jgi:hypothetical protein
MAQNIDQVYIDTFEQNLRHLAQQEGSRLRQFVTERGAGSENHNWERLASAEAAAKTKYAGTPVATPTNDREFSRRVSVAASYNAGEHIALEDPVQMLVDPVSNLVQSMGYAMGRQFDRTIIRATTEAAALNGDGTTTATTALTTIGTGAESISFDFVAQVQEAFMDNNIYPEMPKCFVIGPKQCRQLMNLTEQTSSDYVQASALQQYGMVPNWMGFTWVVSTLLNDLATPLTDELMCFAMTARGVGLHVPQDIHAEVMKDPSNSYAWRPYCETTHGAVRVEDEHIVRIHVENA